MLIFLTLLSCLHASYSELECSVGRWDDLEKWETWGTLGCENGDFADLDQIGPHLLSRLILEEFEGEITKDNFRPIRKVTDLVIYDSNATRIENGAICSLDNLRSLILHAMDLDGEAGVLEGCSHLEKILILEGYVTSNGIFKDLANIRHVLFDDVAFPDATLTKAMLSGLKSVESMRIHFDDEEDEEDPVAPITHIDKDAFADLGDLVNLEICGGRIKFLAPGTFSQQKKLEWLDLSGNNIKKLNWNVFHGLDSLKVFYFRENPFVITDVEEFMRNVLKYTPSLKWIQLSDENYSKARQTLIEDSLRRINVTLSFEDDDEGISFERK